MGSGTSALVEGVDAAQGDDARLAANSKALWGQLIKHAIENRENGSLSPSKTECKSCTYLNEISSHACEMCGEPIAVANGVPNVAPTIKLVTRHDTSLLLQAEHCETIQYRPTATAATSLVPWNEVIVRNNAHVEISGLIPDTLYEIRCCVKGEVAGNVSRIRSGPSVCGPPSAPTALEVGNSYMMLNWDPPLITNGLPIDKYKAEMKPFGGQFELCYEGKERVFVATKLIPEKMYVFRVAALNALGQSIWSRSGAFRTLSDDSPQTEWISSISADGRFFYYHPATDCSCWTLPQGAILDKESAFKRKRHAFLEQLKSEHETILTAVSVTDGENTTSTVNNPNNNNNNSNSNPSFTRIKVNRKDLVNSSYRAFLNLTPKDFARPLRVSYVGEEGIDSGGLVKDWFLELSQALVEGEFGFFTCTANEKDVYRIDPRSKYLHDQKRLEDYYEFIGMFIGKALLDRQTIDVRFDTTILLQLLRIKVSMEDLRGFDPHHYQGLTWMLENDIQGVLEESFSVVVDVMGDKKEIELKPGGRLIDVTNENKAEYVKLMLFYLVTGSCLSQLEALIHGFHKLVPLSLLISNQITPEDLQHLLLGKLEFQVDEIERVATYTGGYDKESKQVKWFWQAFRQFTPGEQHTLLRFITGLHKVPLDGFNPSFTITCSIDDGEKQESLPRSHTCFNQIALPPYESYEVLVEKLQYAIQNTPTEFIMS
jgi:hypothetical protein